MKNLLVILLISSLFSSLIAQQTFYTTGLGTGNWSDPNDWSLNEGEPGPVTPPTADDHVVINHHLTHYTSNTYIHTGMVKVNAGGTYEIITPREGANTYTYGGVAFDVSGTLIVSGDFQHQIAGSGAKGRMIFREGALVYLTQDLILNEAAQLIVNHTSCGAGQTFKNLQLRGQYALISGNGKFIVGGQTRVWNRSGEEVLDESAIKERLQQQMAEGFKLYASGSDCELANAFAVGTRKGIHTQLLNLRGKWAAGRVELLWETNPNEILDFYTVERSKDGISFESIATLATYNWTEDGKHYEIIDENPLKGSAYYRVRKTSYDGQETLSRWFFLDTKPSLQLYPNPATGQNVHLNMSGFAQQANVIVSVKNMMGQELHTLSLQADMSGSILHQLTHSLKPGYYLIQVSTDTHNSAQTLQVY